jgi:hypothetical protein
MLENPHSNCVHFSLFGAIFFCAICVALVNAAVRMTVVRMMDVIFIFFFSY